MDIEQANSDDEFTISGYAADKVIKKAAQVIGNGNKYSNVVVW